MVGGGSESQEHPGKNFPYGKPVRNSTRPARPPKNADLLERLVAYRLETHRTWKNLAQLCGVNDMTLQTAVKRGTMTDRIASIILERLGDVLKMGAGRRRRS